MNGQAEAQNGNGNHRKIVTIAPARLPYHPALEERFGVGQAEWRALVDAIFPLAKEAESIILALSYCRARKLDPFKRVVHIVPMWNSELGRMVETVWPGIGELRTTAFRTRQYAGRDNAEFGPTIKKVIGKVEIEFPEWCQITAYRVLDGQKYPFPGPRVYWMECYATTKKDDPTPNSMWRKRPFGQLDKCAEAAALRAAFPEEIGNDHIAEEMDGKTLGVEKAIAIAPARTLNANLDAIASADLPHDPETGEIMNDERAKQIIEGAENRARYTNKLPAVDGPVTPDAARPSSGEDAGATHPPLDAPASDDIRNYQDNLLSDGRAAATNGTARFEKWRKRLSASDFDRIKPHIDSLREMAAYADARERPSDDEARA